MHNAYYELHYQRLRNTRIKNRKKDVKIVSILFSFARFAIEFIYVLNFVWFFKYNFFFQISVWPCHMYSIFRAQQFQISYKINYCKVFNVAAKKNMFFSVIQQITSHNLFLSFFICGKHENVNSCKIFVFSSIWKNKKLSISFSNNLKFIIIWN